MLDETLAGALCKSTWRISCSSESNDNDDEIVENSFANFTKNDSSQSIVCFHPKENWIVWAQQHAIDFNPSSL